MRRSIAKASLRVTGLFEAELLTELMLRFWNHPLADDDEFRQGLLESAAEALRASVAGEKLMESLQPRFVNLVAAIWYSEWNAATVDTDYPTATIEERKRWLEAVRRALPSCFCDPDLLH